ncbi:hypothetical protein [Arsukibacterium sp.]|uniref:hypothetical protein n=1 Tax=Arsukibacterium sp. TaxID=1977258 RepID=UPI00299E90BF|nr:hypothetical protein [Arsukibacterium sp.]MDX1538295.1 hypothetical protein [Arsukibacterium sp.]
MKKMRGIILALSIASLSKIVNIKFNINQVCKRNRAMKFKYLVIGALLCSVNYAAHATLINTVEVDMPGGVPTLQAERAIWASGLNSLITEGFEGAFTVSNSIDFGSFIVSISGGPSLMQFSGANPSTRTEGNNALGFSSSAVLTFSFLENISAFGIDWSSLESSRSSLDYSDSEGNSFTNIFPSNNSVTAGFFGISDVNISSLSFSVDSVETLEFDFIQFETIQVSEPTTLSLMCLLLIAMFRFRRS